MQFVETIYSAVAFGFITGIFIFVYRVLKRYDRTIELFGKKSHQPENVVENRESEEEQEHSKIIFKKQKMETSNLPANGKKILHFEDDEFMAEVYRREFEAQGYEYKFYTQPSDSYIMDILEYNPDVIITNMFMPKMGGLELLEAIRTDKRTAQYPIVFLTSVDDRETVEAANKWGISDFLVKSQVTPKEVIAKIGLLTNAHEQTVN